MTKSRKALVIDSNVDNDRRRSLFGDVLTREETLTEYADSVEEGRRTGRPVVHRMGALRRVRHRRPPWFQGARQKVDGLDVQ